MPTTTRRSSSTHLQKNATKASPRGKRSTSMSTAPRGRSCRSNWKSKWSVFGAVSTLSFASFCSFGSALSLISCASVLSILSIGSTASILSIGSINSILSIGSNGCTFRYFANCMAPFPEPEVEFSIQIPDEAWKNMSACTFDDYQKSKKHESDKTSHCDYHVATCSFRNMNMTTPISNIRCKVRRKGFTTWEDMDRKPSFKLKFETDDGKDDRDIDMGTIDNILMNEINEVTLNNMKYSDSWSGNREVEAYDLFRNIGFPAMPAAAYAKVTLRKGNHTVNTHTYGMIQNVNDGFYMKQQLWPSQHQTVYDKDKNGYILFEVDGRGLELKKSKNYYKNKALDLDLSKAVINRESDILDYMDRDEMSKFFIGELLTKNWDGACLRYIPNNYYIAVTGNSTDEFKVRYVPKGMDRVFHGCTYEMMSWLMFMGGANPPYCGPMQAILGDPTGKAHYEKLKAAAEPLAKYESSTCAKDVGIMGIIILGTIAIVGASLLLSVVAVYIFRKQKLPLSV